MSKMKGNTSVMEGASKFPSNLAENQTLAEFPNTQADNQALAEFSSTLAENQALVDELQAEISDLELRGEFLLAEKVHLEVINTFIIER